MTTLAKIHRKGQVTLPTKFRDIVGIAEGDMVEMSVVSGKIVITPTLIIDRSKFPNADDEYTPAQRRYIDARLAESEAEYKAGGGYGPFNTAEEAIASMKVELKKRVVAKKTKRVK